MDASLRNNGVRVVLGVIVIKAAASLLSPVSLSRFRLAQQTRHVRLRETRGEQRRLFAPDIRSWCFYFSFLPFFCFLSILHSFCCACVHEVSFLCAEAKLNAAHLRRSYSSAPPRIPSRLASPFHRHLEWGLRVRP